MKMVEERRRAEQLIEIINKLELENEASKKSREQLKSTIEKLMEENKENREALDIATHAIEILREVSDESVGEAYRFLEKSLNTALERMFKGTTRKIELHEYIYRNQYPQLEIILHVGNGRTRSLASDSGHGIAQLISLLSVICIIVITGSRRLVVLDEVTSGLSVENRKVLSDILWTFTEIGFQFIINDHGYVPKGSYVHHLEMVGDVSGVKDRYIATKGVYLQGKDDIKFNYSEETEETEEIEESNLNNKDDTEMYKEEIQEDVISI